ncbi:hypothetical protein PR048_007733 [Dryococelus australis]|uniref:Uncharacterized protein n=1 Tax=Dryococelus australis TaxID=614101 RepID=A0ABQ9HVY8_9NEOP|nr:hypothetical protein PR048_007733 [Dryococelus australis]
MKGRRKRETPEKTPPTSGIVRHDSHMRKSGGDPDENRTPFAQARKTRLFSKVFGQERHRKYLENSLGNTSVAVGQDVTPLYEEYWSCLYVYADSQYVIPAGIVGFAYPPGNVYLPPKVCERLARNRQYVIPAGIVGFAYPPGNVYLPPKVCERFTRNRLLASLQSEPSSIPGRVTPGGFSHVTRAGRCRWSAGFLGDLPFPPPFHPGSAPYPP